MSQHNLEIPDYPQARLLLERLTNDFYNNLKLSPAIATELEFFFLAKNKNSKISDKKISIVINEIEDNIRKLNICSSNITQETGENQYEINLDYSDDILKIADDTVKLREIITTTAKKNNIIASFFSKPHGNKDVGSGLHIHLSLHDDNENNMFFKENGQENNLLLHSIAGLLSFLPASIAFFIADADDFARYKAKFELNEDDIRYSSNSNNAPVNISWGINNRTTAIRIPTTNQAPNTYRIEHRVPSSNANPYLVISAMLFAVKYGITNKLMPQEKTWGNAFDNQYHLPPLPSNLKKAFSLYKKSELYRYVNL